MIDAVLIGSLGDAVAATMRDQAVIHAEVVTQSEGIGKRKSWQSLTAPIPCRGVQASLARLDFGRDIEITANSYLLTLPAGTLVTAANRIEWRRADGRVLWLRVLGHMETTYQTCERVICDQIPAEAL